MTKRNPRRSQCIQCHKRTTYNPNRLVLIRQQRADCCLVKMYGILCAGCFRDRNALTEIKDATLRA